MRPVLCVISIFGIAFSSFSQVVAFKNGSFDFLTKNLIMEELARYPKELLNQYLDSVIVQDIKFCGRAHAFDKYIVLNPKCDHKRMTIHHEISSVFLIRYDMNIDPSFGDKLLRQFYDLNGLYKYDRDASPADFEKGDPKCDYFYKRNYSTTNFENDFNVIAEYLWTEGKETVEFMLSNPNKPVSRKIKLVMEFYKKLDNRFDSEFFRRQNLAQLN